MGRLLAAELFKLRRRLMTQVLALIVVLLFVVGQVPRWRDEVHPSNASGPVGGTVTEIGPDGEPRTIVIGGPEEVERTPADEAGLREAFLERTFDGNLEAARWLIMLFGIVLTAGALGSEYSWGTLRPFLTCVESRTKYLGAKLAALGIIILGGMATALAAAIVSSIIIAIADGGAGFGFVDGPYLQDAFFDFWRTAYSISPYVLVTALAAIVGRSALTGAFGGFGLLIADSIATGTMQGSTTWLRHVPDYLPSSNVDALVGVTSFEEVAPRDPWAAALVLAVYAVGAIVAALWVFHRRDVTA
jgi:ABC-type transport system involved in multi-copper enzyme maturation permease subunit